MNSARFLVCSVFLAALLASSGSASAQLRTFVASTGSDSNPCSRVAPCRTFQGAVNATAAGGEVVALDSAGFGPNVTINKAISIIASPGVYAAVTVSSGDGISISAGPNDIVTLRGLTVDSSGSNGSGIANQTAAALHIENCVISGFNPGVGGIVQRASGQLFVKDTIVKNNGKGIFLASFTAGSTLVTLDNVTITDNNFGLFVHASNSGQIEAAIIRSSISGNITGGVGVEGSDAGTAFLDIESCLITNNGANNGAGVEVVELLGSAAASISNCLISHNSTAGFNVGPGTAIFSRGNNTIIGNGPNTGSLTALAGQ